VRCGDYSHIHFDGFTAAYPFIFTLLQYAQQPHLNVGREVANSIEKERAATGFFKASVFVPYRTSKSAYNMSEEFTFEQAFGER